MSENEEQGRNTSGKVNDKWGTREDVDVSDSGFHHKVTVSSRKEHDIGSMW